MWPFLLFLVVKEVVIGAHPLLNVNRTSRLIFINQRLKFPKTDGDTKLSPKCGHKTYCDFVENYPEDVFYKILKNPENEKKYFQYFRNVALNEAIIERNNKNEQYICPSNRNIVYPKVAYNMKNELKFIYNLDRYRQGVAIDVCVKRSKCKFYDKVQNYDTKCRQKYVEKLLLTADENGRPYVDRYKFPSACVCSYKANGYSRFLKFFS